jgi:hypothetical protein
MTNLLVGILAGLASALTVMAGWRLGALLYLAPLPILIGALGWKHRSGLPQSAALRWRCSSSRKPALPS